jgi:hypothetical protein
MNEETVDRTRTEPNAVDCRLTEESRRRRSREDEAIRRSMAINLAKGLALSEFLSTVTTSPWVECQEKD